MSSRDQELPSFRSPPVTEVVLSVQFEPISGFQLHHFGTVWGSFKEQFPEVQTQPPLPPVFEQVDIPERQPGIQFLFGGTPALLPRMWLTNKSGTELLQIQNDRFIHNWRKTGEGTTYPRYERLREEFIAEFERFSSAIKQIGLSVPRANQCEVTYINQIAAGTGWSQHSDVAEITNLISPCVDVPTYLTHEGTNITARYLIHDEESSTKVVGRLHLEMVPAFAAPKGTPIFVLNLTARGEPVGVGDDGVLAFFDMGRKAIVQTFRAITTQNMHAIWGIENGS